MFDIENNSNSLCEEPEIYYYSTSSNIGVGAKFSDRNKKIQKSHNMDYSTHMSSNNNKYNFSLYNTIMLPFITTEATLESEQNNYYYFNNNNKNEKNKNKSYTKKDNTRIKTDSSKDLKDDKNISDDKQLTNTILDIKETNDSINKKDINNNKESTHLEENPFFLGKNLAIYNYNYNNQSKLKKSLKDTNNIRDPNNHSRNNNNINHHNNSNHHSIHNNNNNNNSINNSEKNENDAKDFFNSGPSKSVICEDKKRRKSIRDDDKSENLVKKSKKLNLKKSFLNPKTENKKAKYLKKKSFFIQPKNFRKEIEKKEKLKTDSKNVSVGNRSKSYYYSNKQIANICDQNILKTIAKKMKPDSDDNNGCEKNSESLNIKRSSNKVRSQRVSYKQNKQKNSKDENRKSNNIKSNRLKINTISKGIKSLKDFINTKEKEKDKEKEKKDRDGDNSSKERSINIKKNKKSEGKNQRYNSKKEIKRIKLNKKEFEKETVKGQKSLDMNNIKIINEMIKKNEKNLEEKEEMQNKLKSSKQIVIKDIENKDSSKNKINKCLTADLVRKKSFNIKNRNNNYTSGKKKMAEMVGIKLFGNDNNNVKKQKKIDFEFALKNNLKKMQFNLFSKDKFTNTEFSDSDYLNYTLECMELILDLDIEKQTRLKNQINFNFPKSKKNKNKKKIALFDLDETIVHCTGDINTQKEKYQHIVEIKLPGKQAVKVGINIRPFWKQTLNLIKKKYHIVVYTASHQAYADSVLDFMDPNKKYFKYRLYRNNCSLVDVDGSKFYVKDLDIFKEHYDLKDIVIVDNSVLSFSFHLHNGIPIVPYYDEDKDGSLYVVGLYLVHIFKEDDLREANKKQINLDSFMEEAKKRREEEYVDVNQIDEESDSKEDDENNNDNKTKKNNDNNKDKNISNGKSLHKVSRKSFDEKGSGPKKISEKRLNLMRKHSSKILCKLDPHSEQNNDIAQKKLMSQSRLINMYYEVKGKSSKNETNIESNKEKKTKKNIVKERKGSPDDQSNKTNKTTIVFVDNNEEDYECKSDPGNFHNISDNESSEDEKELAILKRVYTIIGDDQVENNNEINSGDKTTKNNSKSKLGFIRSNFYNNFKI